MRPSPLPQSAVPKSVLIKPLLPAGDTAPGVQLSQDHNDLGSAGSSPTRLVPRGGEHKQEDGMLHLPNGASQEQWDPLLCTAAFFN